MHLGIGSHCMSAHLFPFDVERTIRCHTESNEDCCDIMDNMGDDSVIKRVKGGVIELCKSRPLYEFNQDL